MIRIRLTRLPSTRDLEYFALRYLELNGVYEVPLEMAKDLIEFGYATPSGASQPLSRFGDVREIPEDPD
jgi:hypothetical protein